MPASVILAMLAAVVEDAEKFDPAESVRFPATKLVTLLERLTVVISVEKELTVTVIVLFWLRVSVAVAVAVAVTVRVSSGLKAVPLANAEAMPSWVV